MIQAVWNALVGNLILQDPLWLLGVTLLLTAVSSALPIPSELMVSPIAYLIIFTECDGLVQRVLWGILLICVSTVGSYLGSAISYSISRVAGRPLIVKYGKYLLLPEKKVKIGEMWVERYGAGGIFLARLLPIVRHVISIPAGIMGMRFLTFSWMTLLGSAVWCAILTIFGLLMSKDMSLLLKGTVDVESAEFKHAFGNLTWATIALVAVIVLLYYFAIHRRHHTPRQAATEEPMSADASPSM